MVLREIILGALLLAVPRACLPTDEQAEPGRVEVRVRAAPERAELATEDGWHIRYEELFIAIGNVRLDRVSDEVRCQPYNEISYLRVVDLLNGSGRLATVFGRGQCALRLQTAEPVHFDVVSDVDAAIVAAMKQRASDGFVEDRSVVLRIAGTASRADVVYRFAWLLRQAFDYDPCATFAFEPGAPGAIDVQVRIDELFTDTLGGTRRFEPFAAADLDGNFEITLAELRQVPAGDHLYFEAAAQLVWVEGRAPCFVGMIDQR